MSLETSLRTPRTSRISVALLVSLISSPAFAESITGTATFRERIVLRPDAVFEAILEDVSRADARAETIASTRATSPGNPPIAFTIAYDPSRIVAEHRYGVRARILVGGRLLFATDTAVPVITGGNPTNVSLMLRRVGAGQAPQLAAASAVPLAGTHWRAIELAGKPTPAQDPKREAHLVFQEGGHVSGSDGCNRITGSYELKGDAITFGQMAGTQMACLDTGDIERAFREAMKAAGRSRITGDRLELFDAAGQPVAVFAARAQATPEGLAGTSWQLVKLQGSDDTTLLPNDGAKYTIQFGANGQLSVRFDCNRGRGAWRATGPSGLQFGPLALTRAKCPPGSLHDRMVKQWPNIRSYVLREGHLFLALMADGGIYEFEPTKNPRR